MATDDAAVQHRRMLILLDRDLFDNDNDGSSDSASSSLGSRLLACLTSNESELTLVNVGGGRKTMTQVCVTRLKVPRAVEWHLRAEGDDDDEPPAHSYQTHRAVFRRRAEVERHLRPDDLAEYDRWLAGLSTALAPGRDKLRLVIVPAEKRAPPAAFLYLLHASQARRAYEVFLPSDDDALAQWAYRYSKALAKGASLSASYAASAAWKPAGKTVRVDAATRCGLAKLWRQQVEALPRRGRKRGDEAALPAPSRIRADPVAFRERMSQQLQDVMAVSEK